MRKNLERWLLKSMRQKFYIADYHIGHNNLNFLMDKRGFSSVDEMNNYIFSQWNEVVKPGDEVYIIGDFIWNYEWSKLPELFNHLHGKKYLIIGNHDNRWLKHFDNEKHHAFNWIKDYAEINDNGRRVILSHYPMIIYNHQFSENTWMLHGHIHVTQDVDLFEQCKDIFRSDVRIGYRGIESPHVNIVNCFCMFSDYKPLTLDKWIEKEKSGELRDKQILTKGGAV